MSENRKTALPPNAVAAVSLRDTNAHTTVTVLLSLMSACFRIQQAVEEPKQKKQKRHKGAEE